MHLLNSSPLTLVTSSRSVCSDPEPSRLFRDSVQVLESVYMPVCLLPCSSPCPSQPIYFYLCPCLPVCMPVSVPMFVIVMFVCLSLRLLHRRSQYLCLCLFFRCQSVGPADSFLCLPLCASLTDTVCLSLSVSLCHSVDDCFSISIYLSVQASLLVPLSRLVFLSLCVFFCPCLAVFVCVCLCSFVFLSVCCTFYHFLACLSI